MKKQAHCFRHLLSPLGRISQVGLGAARQILMDLFQQWGLPLAIRTDNGEPFGVPTRDVVPIMSLWIISWGIIPIINRPRVPQDNAKVERNQGTVGRWLEVENCQSMGEVQKRLDEICMIHQGQYRVRKLSNTTREQTFKDLFEIKRPLEKAIFDEKKAHMCLAKASYPRKINMNGAVSIYNKVVQVHHKYRNTTVVLKFDPELIAWNVFDQSGKLLKTIPDDRFSKQNLFDLTVFQ